jgi:cobalamin synthase
MWSIVILAYTFMSLAVTLIMWDTKPAQRYAAIVQAIYTPKRNWQLILGNVIAYALFIPALLILSVSWLFKEVK